MTGEPHLRPADGRSAATGGRTFFHPQALVESPHVGEGTRIWAFAHVLPGARIGADCNICDGVFVENDVIVGDRVTVKCGVQLWDGVVLEDDVFVGPNATFTNDPFPRSRQHPERYARTIVRRGASIGANATLLPGVTIGAGAMVGAGSVVTRDVPPDSVVVGNPARARNGPASAGPSEASVVSLEMFVDERGSLTFAQVGDHLPFVPRRYFAIMDVPAGQVRGAHAHRRVEQFLVCLRGGCTVSLESTRGLRTVRLDTPRAGLYVPPMTWNELTDFTPDAMVLCLASEEYDADEYIRDHDEFARACRT